MKKFCKWFIHKLAHLTHQNEGRYICCVDSDTRETITGFKCAGCNVIQEVKTYSARKS